MKALIVGFGGIGCRHAQSLLASKKYRTITVVEPEDGKFHDGLARIGAGPADLVRLTSLEQLTDGADIAVVATTSGPRFRIMKGLLDRGFKRFLVEKIVFQSLADFDHIIAGLKTMNAQAYCNFTNRYFMNYIKIKDRIAASETSVSMTVTGGDLGLGSNAVHYMDLFEYLTGKAVTAVSSKLRVSDKENKRGSSYKEFSGLISARNGNGDSLHIYFDPSHNGGITIHVGMEKESFMLSEASLTQFDISGNGIVQSEFQLLPSSRLTSTIVDDILNNRSLLTTIPQTANVHGFLFREINGTLNLPEGRDTVCPIT